MDIYPTMTVINVNELDYRFITAILYVYTDFMKRLSWNFRHLQQTTLKREFLLMRRLSRIRTLSAGLHQRVVPEITDSWFKLSDSFLQRSCRYKVGKD